MRAAALLLALVLPVLAEEEPVREITLREAIDLGLAYNLGLHSVRLEALMARLAVRAEEAAWDPTFSSDVGSSETLTPSRSQLAGADVVDTDNTFFTLGLTKPFHVGPSLGIAWRADRTFNNSSFSTINPAYDTALDVTLVVPLLRGRGRGAQESLLRASMAGAEGARWQLEDEAGRLVLSVAQAYWNVVYLEGQVGVLRKSVEVAREIEATERRKTQPDIGRSTVLDVTQAEAETKRREAALIKGRLDAGNAADELRTLILPFSGEETDRIRLQPTGVPEEAAEVPELAGLVAAALERRADLRKADADIRRLEEGVVAAKDALRFRLDLSAGISWRGVDSQFPSSAERTLTGENPSVSGGFGFTWPIGRRAARSALRRAELDLERGEVARRELVNGIIMEVRRAHRTLRTALREIEATAQEVVAASAALEGERKRLERGSSTVLNVAQLEENLTSAQLRRLQARTALEQARVAVQQVTGTLLERLGIDFDGELHPQRDEP